MDVRFGYLKQGIEPIFNFSILGCLLIRRTSSSSQFDFKGTAVLYLHQRNYPYNLLAFNLKCVVPENIHTSLPLWKFQLSFVNLLNFFGLTDPPPGNSNPFCGECMDTFWNSTM